MTNGEKLCIDFPNMRYTISEHRVITTIGVAASFDLDWWNAEYKDPTTKNDLGVDVVSRQAVHDMLENLPVTVEDKWFNWLQKACMRLAELPSVTPQEPKTGHWIDKNKNSAICSCCNRNNILYGDFCKWCGAKMIEPQESEDKEC